MNRTRLSSIYAGACIALAGSALLTGCGVQSHQLAGAGTQSLVIRGKVFGGQQPITQSKVYLYATTTSGYGAAATSLLNAPGYVSTDGNGNFTLTGDYSTASCPSSSSEAYVLALGGNPGSGTNTAVALMAPLGLCSALNSSITVNVNEVTTVASVYALHQFLDTTGHNIGTSAGNTAGLANAFATINNIVNVAGGYAYTTANNGSSNGTVPQATINALANLLSTCVNDSTVCASLFSASTPGTAPTDTLGLALALASNPAYNVSNTYQLTSATPPFSPTLSTAPNDWGLEVIYSGSPGVAINAARYLDIDANSNIYIANAVAGAGFLSEFSNLGVPLAQATGTSPMQGVAIDATGNIYSSSNAYTSGVGALYTFGQSLQTPTAYSLTTCQPWQIAADVSGNIITGNVTADGTNPGLCSFTPGTHQNTFLGVGYAATAENGISIGPANIVWASMPVATNGGSNQGLLDAVDTSGSLSYDTNNHTAGFPQSGQGGSFYSVAAGPNYAYVVGGAGNGVLYAISATANTGATLKSQQINLASATTANVSRDAILDGNQNLWFTLNNGMLYTLNGASLNYYALQNSSLTNLWGLGIDESGNVWASVPGTTGALAQYIGVAAPLQTPRAAALASGHTAASP